MRFFIFTFCIFITLNFPALSNEVGKETGLPIPRFVTLKSNEINVRNGPSNRYPIKWVYQRKGYPMKIVGEFGNWRKIQDIDGEEGWVHEALVTGRRNAVIINNKIDKNKISFKLPDKEMVLLRHPNEQSFPLVRVEIGAMGKIIECSELWCKLQVDTFSGWILKENIWGVTMKEIIKKGKSSR